MSTNESPATPREYAATLLLVDDEQNILTAQRRLFRPLGYRIFLAGGGAEGLDILAREQVDLVISDMRMPEMDGAAFLARVAEQWPDTVRILLTGYADLTSTIDAINKGGIYRYISKPWEDNDLVLTVQQALRHKELERERDRLLDLTHRQNEELRSLNAGLEEKVRQRTAEIQQTADMLDLAYVELKRSYVTAIPVFANLVELREGPMAGHGRRVGDLGRALAERMKLGEEDVQDVYFAGLLHDVGKIGLPDELLQRPYGKLSDSERERVEQHPVMGESALLALEPMAGAARLIRSHHERFDGTGYPDRLIGENIPLGARILAVANDYDGLQRGAVLEEALTPAQARNFLVSHRFKRYDPAVVDTFVKMLDIQSEPADARGELLLTTAQLRAGMVLSRDLVNHDGILLLTREYQLTTALITKMQAFERDSGHKLVVRVWDPKEDKENVA